MFRYEPATTLATVAAPITALLAADDERHARGAALADASAARSPPVAIRSASCRSGTPATT